MFKIDFEKFIFSYNFLENFSVSEYANHAHNQTEILLFMQGAANYNISGKIYNLQPMDLIIIPSEYFHNITLLKNDLYERMLFNFDITTLNDAQSKKIFSSPLIINIKGNSKLENLFHRFNEFRLTLEGEDYTLAIELCFTELILRLKHSEIKQPDLNYTVNNTVTKILEFISHNLSNELSLDNIANSLYISKSHLKNVFSKFMKIGLQSYINNMRIIKAQTMLKDGHKPKDVYLRCGFTSYPTFFREYKKITGNIPSKEFKK